MEDKLIKSDHMSTEYGSTIQEPVTQEHLSKWHTIIRLITSLRIEPVMFMFMFSYILNTTCLSNMMMDKGCRYYFNYSSDVCKNITAHRNESDNLEILANNYNLYLNLLAPIGAVVVIFLAPWSDRYGRKPLLTIALCGFFIYDIGIILCTLYFESGLYFIIIANLATQFTGGFVCVMTVIFSHASEVSTNEQRSLKYTFIQIAFGLAVTLGALCGGQLYHQFGYMAVFTTMAAGHLLTILWVRFMVPETRGQENHDPFCQKLAMMFASQNFVDGVKTCLKVRKGNGRLQIWMLLLSSCTFTLTYEVYTSIAYVYAHHMYKWDPTEYSEMWTIFSFAEMLIVLSCTPFFIRVLGFSDPVIGVIGVVSMVGKNVFLAFAYQLWLFYLSNIFGSLNGLSVLAARTLMSKLVDENELGRVFSFMETCEAIVPLLGSAVVAKTFNATIKVFPGACYLAATGFLVIPLFTFLWQFKLRRYELSSQLHEM